MTSLYHSMSKRIALATAGVEISKFLEEFRAWCDRAGAPTEGGTATGVPPAFTCLSRGMARSASAESEEARRLKDR